MKRYSTILSALLGLLLLSLVAVPQVVAESTLELQILGVSDSALANVTEALQPPAGLISDGKLNTLWLNRYLRQAPAKVARALEPFGYYTAKVALQVDRQTTPPTIRVTIDPGTPVRIASRHLDIVGDQPSELLQKLARFPLAPGDVLLHLPYEQAKAELLALAVDLGYLDASFSSHQIRVSREAGTADLELVLATGPRYRFGAIGLTGGEEYPERFLRRYLTARQGDIFSYSELGKTQQRLLDSDRFSNVIIAPQREDARDEAVPVEIRLDSKAPIRLRPGIGYGTDTGARIFLRYQDVNVGGLGHELTGDLLVAERKQNLLGSYLFPGYRNIDTQLALRGGYQEETLDAYETSYVFAEAEQLYGFTEGRVGSMFVRFQQESSTISGEEISTGTLMPGLRFRVGKLDDPIRPKQGYHLSLEIRGTWSALISDVTLLQALGDINWITPLPWRTYLNLRGSAATTVQQDDFAELPASLRFFAGGDHSVRGYAYQSLGPTNELGEVVGGKNLLVGSVELEKRFLQSWGAALFYDVGNAFNNLGSYELAHAVGVGVRYFTPVGPARIDLARTLGTDKDGFRLHIGLGVGW
jgi:translocation and assembly module TamA